MNKGFSWKYHGTVKVSSLDEVEVSHPNPNISTVAVFVVKSLNIKTISQNSICTLM